MKFVNKPVLAALVITLVLLLVPQQSNAGNPMKKLGRGIANIAFGPLEVPMKIYDVSQDQGGIAGLTYGTFLGIGYFLAREGVGIVDTLTFPMPLPDCTDDPKEVGWGYGPLMRPEWVVDEEHNLFNVFYDNAPAMN